MNPACEDIDLNAFHDGECADAARVQAHLNGCPACRDELQDLRRLDALVRGPSPTALSWPAPRRPRRIETWLLKAALIGLGLTTLLHWWPRPRPTVPGNYQVAHGSRLYKLEVRGAQLLDLELEDEFGKGQVPLHKPKEID